MSMAFTDAYSAPGAALPAKDAAMTKQPIIPVLGHTAGGERNQTNKQINQHAVYCQYHLLPFTKTEQGKAMGGVGCVPWKKVRKSP